MHLLRNFFLFIFLVTNISICYSQNDTSYVLVAARVFDGEEMHEDWKVVIKNNKIISVGLTPDVAAPSKTVELKNCTLLPGLIEGHSHLFLHPYNETPWVDQVLKESRAERLARATVHAKNTLLAGFTTVRDLGTEGSLYDDVGLKHAIEIGIIPGPRMLVATRAIVATGSYDPKVISNDIETVRGAAEADGESLIKEVRTQIGKGADLIKIYADYGWGINGKIVPTFTADELRKVVEAANSSGRLVVAHSTTIEGMKRAIMAGVSTIEHGNEGSFEVFKLMKENSIAFCPTLVASEAYEQYSGWKKGIDAEPASITAKRKSFAAALKAGVTICMGGDVGVFSHGDNACEMELMTDYGMKPEDVLRSATSVNAAVFKIANIVGRIKPGLLADILIVQGDPSKNIHDIRSVKLVIKNGVFY
jgi:imidazolonepropionase-like amidohydrolase